ncbi:acyltransferase family protein [Polaromonas sp. AET17H-212]|uniref:acyltransferase family protein n=1 Tax=Polaromonas sp. AET17H-212 TaxID=1977061 RepID=UPI000BBBB9B0|nr:acyltransferase [Polaromonas sp. AET17H-212]
MKTPVAVLTPSAQRLPGVDALKALGCVLIVWHHLAFYGPMSDVVHTAAPGLMNWLYDYARMAVQVFLVVGGFLAASVLAPEGVAVFRQPGRLILRRYQRLALPLFVALLVTTLVAALVRPWLPHPSVPDMPTVWQVLAHVFLLQDIVGQEALSAGIWYVAIDFQLFVMTVLLFTLTSHAHRRWPGLPAQAGVWAVLGLAAASLGVFNRHAALDMTGLYFFGAYALGMLAWWASHSPRPARWLLAIAVLGVLALALDFRGRLLVALVVALSLVALQRSRPVRWLQAPWLLQLGQMSYSVFLIHFAVLLGVNAVVSQFWPTQLVANALGMLAAFGLSLLAGQALYLGVESRRRPARVSPGSGVSVP